MIGGAADREDDVSGMAASSFDTTTLEWVRAPVLLPKSLPPRVSGECHLLMPCLCLCV